MGGSFISVKSCTGAVLAPRLRVPPSVPAGCPGGLSPPHRGAGSPAREGQRAGSWCDGSEEGAVRQGGGHRLGQEGWPRKERHAHKWKKESHWKEASSALRMSHNTRSPLGAPPHPAHGPVLFPTHPPQQRGSPTGERRIKTTKTPLCSPLRIKKGNLYSY